MFSLAAFPFAKPEGTLFDAEVTEVDNEVRIIAPNCPMRSIIKLLDLPEILCFHAVINDHREAVMVNGCRGCLDVISPDRQYPVHAGPVSVRCGAQRKMGE